MKKKLKINETKMFNFTHNWEFFFIVEPNCKELLSTNRTVGHFGLYQPSEVD